MSTNIYVGNLSYDASEDDLANLFAQFGDVVSARIISDKNTNRSKGFGFVEMSEADAAKAAISGLNSTEWMSRSIKVNEAEPRTERPRNNY